MKTMKKIWKYFLNFVFLFLIVTGLSFWGSTINDKNGTKENKQITYTVQENSPVIEITKCTSNKITGTATNDMNVLINVVYIKADFYNENNELIGTQYDEIKYFNVGEKSKFQIDYKYKDVVRIDVTATNSK